MLITTSTSVSSFAKMPFVVKRNSIGYNFSLQFYLHNKTERLKTELLGVFPVFKSSEKELIYTINEAESIARKVSSTFLMYENATKANFLNVANDYSVLHFSTHASSGDFVNPPTLSFYDNTLQLDELYNLNITPNLVVLSACETGVGKLLKGEGAMSIARGFQYAGAENILFSLWKINDLSTSKIMTSFYEHYANGKSATFSNKQSKVDYLNNSNINNAKKSPYYWSAFVFYGDLPELKTTNQYYYLVFSVFLVLLLIVILVHKFKSKNENHT